MGQISFKQLALRVVEHRSSASFDRRRMQEREARDDEKRACPVHTTPIKGCALANSPTENQTYLQDKTSALEGFLEKGWLTSEGNRICTETIRIPDKHSLSDSVLRVARVHARTLVSERMELRHTMILTNTDPNGLAQHVRSRCSVHSRLSCPGTMFIGCESVASVTFKWCWSIAMTNQDDLTLSKADTINDSTSQGLA